MTMRKMKLIYVWLLGLVTVLTACADEEIVKTYNIKEGVPVTVNLKFNVAASAVESRSAQDATVEQTVQRLFVIAFKRNGEVSGKTYLESVNATGSGTVTLDMYSGTGQQIFAVANPNSGVGTLSYEQLDDVTNLDDFKALHSQLRTDKGETVSLSVERMAFLMCGQLKNTEGGTDIAVDAQGNLVEAADKIDLERVDARITFNVKADGSEKGYTNMTFTPKYYRVENIPQGTYLVPRENEDYAATMETGYASMQAAGKEYYFDEAKRENDDWSYFEFYLLENRRQPRKKITSEEKETYSEVQNLYALREKRESDTGKPVDETKPGQEYVPGDFIFAPENSTYVTIRGTLSFESFEDNEKYFYNADVTYTVHLGSTGNKKDNGVDWSNDVDLVNNYDVRRNTHYTYNVTITGVESMRVEVVSDKEERPGVEGDVIKAGGEVVDLDSHYGRAKFSLTRGDIKAGLSWAISTPFQRGLKVFVRSNYTENESEDGTVVSDVARLSSNQVENLKTGLSLNDYRWVQFAINQECVLKKTGEPVPPSAFAKYPGYAAYSSKDLSEQAPAFGGEGYHYSGSTAIYSKDVVLYDVNQLLNHLFIEAYKSDSQLFLDANGNVSQADNATVTITAYIDEYVYKYNPNDVYYEIPTALKDGDPDLTLWKDFVNAENRMLHICKKGAQYSPDGNTSWAESVITFSQRSIYTFYDPDSDVSTAWGTEFKNESEDANLPATSSALNGITWNKGNNTFDDGRNNTVQVLGQLTDLKWTDVLYLNEADYGRLKEGYKCVWFACLGRNRDLDGDNIVDLDEIRWYLASVDQLTDIFIAEAAVPNAKLYSQNATSTNVPLEHVISSTYNTITASTMSPWIIWAEEGASRGNLGHENENGPYTYRCLRNLGLSLSSIASQVDDYVISKDENGDIITKDRKVKVGRETVTYTERFIDLSRLEPNTLRAALTGGILPQNKERDDNDRPYRKFAVLVSAEGDRWNSSYDNASGLYPKNDYWTWNNLYNYENNGNPCPDGYRAPNLRELMLMYTTYPDLFETKFGESSSSYYLCKTGFSFNGWGHYNDDSGSPNRPGFVYVYEYNTSKPSASYGNLMLLTGGGTSGKVRCVRDVIGE